MVVTITLERLHQAHSALDLPRTEPGGKGRSGMATKEEDAADATMLVTSTHTPVLFFDQGQGLSPQGLAPARRWADDARTADGQSAPGLGRRRNDRDRAGAARGRGGMGQLSVVFATAKGNVRRNSMDASPTCPATASSR